MMIVVSIIAKKKGYPIQKRAEFISILKASGKAIFPLLCPVILIGGIWSGIFTPTEAAAVAVLYSLFLGMVLYRELSWQSLLKVLREALDDTCVILFIIAAASVYGWLLARYQIPSGIAEKILSITTDPWIILLLINGFLLIVGCFLESLAAINILTPILLPLVMKVGIDPLHFGLIMVLNLMIGLLTPPVGMVLYAVQRVADISFARLQRSLLVFFIPLLAVLLLITLYPPLVTWLPSLVWKK